MSKRNAPEVQTFGCRLNIWESEVMRNQAGAAGLSDAIIFNTCAVTAEAEKPVSYTHLTLPTTPYV